jgi:hypothetical protein
MIWRSRTNGSMCWPMRFHMGKLVRPPTRVVYRDRGHDGHMGCMPPSGCTGRSGTNGRAPLAQHSPDSQCETVHAGATPSGNTMTRIVRSSWLVQHERWKIVPVEAYAGKTTERPYCATGEPCGRGDRRRDGRRSLALRCTAAIGRQTRV